MKEMVIAPSKQAFWKNTAYFYTMYTEFTDEIMAFPDKGQFLLCTLLKIGCNTWKVIQGTGACTCLCIYTSSKSSHFKICSSADQLWLSLWNQSSIVFRPDWCVPLCFHSVDLGLLEQDVNFWDCYRSTWRNPKWLCEFWRSFLPWKMYVDYEDSWVGWPRIFFLLLLAEVFYF